MALLPAFGSYSKLINGAIGYIVGVGMSWLAMKGLATCAPVAGGVGGEMCEIWGATQIEVTTFVSGAVGALFVWQSPANT